MKVYLLPVFFVSMFAISCGTNGKSNAADSTKSDSMNGNNKDSVTANANDTNVLEDLLAYNSEKALIEKFGKSRVKYDTIWGAEGFFTMGSYLDEGTPDQVQFTWKDSLNRTGNISVMSMVPFNSETGYTGTSIWHSKAGLTIGMKVADVQAINGHQFKFSGIGWDYGGGIVDWEKGKLDNAGVTVQLDADYNIHSSETDYNAVSGDKDVSSDDPSVKAVGMKVVQVFVYKPND